MYNLAIGAQEPWKAVQDGDPSTQSEPMRATPYLPPGEGSRLFIPAASCATQ